MRDALLDHLLRDGDDVRAERALVAQDARRADVARRVDDQVLALEGPALREVLVDRDAVNRGDVGSYSRPSVTAATIESMIVTCRPAASKASTTCEPMKPNPPVTTTRCIRAPAI